MLAVAHDISATSLLNLDFASAANFRFPPFMRFNRLLKNDSEEHFSSTSSLRDTVHFSQLDESGRKTSPFGHKRCDGGVFQRPVKATLRVCGPNVKSGLILLKNSRSRLKGPDNQNIFP
jgi:hypothetical protein